MNPFPAKDFANIQFIMLTSQVKWKHCTKIIIAASQSSNTFLKEKCLEKRNSRAATLLKRMCCKSVIPLGSGVCEESIHASEGFPPKVMEAGLALQQFYKHLEQISISVLITPLAWQERHVCARQYNWTHLGNGFRASFLLLFCLGNRQVKVDTFFPTTLPPSSNFLQWVQFGGKWGVRKYATFKCLQNPWILPNIFLYCGHWAWNG